MGRGKEEREWERKREGEGRKGRRERKRVRQGGSVKEGVEGWGSGVGGADRGRESAGVSEGICQLRHTSCALTHTASHDKLHHRQGRRGPGGGALHRESTSTSMDTHLAHT